MKPFIYISIIMVILSSCAQNEKIVNSIYKINPREDNPMISQRNEIYETEENKYYDNEIYDNENESIDIRSEKIGNYLLKLDIIKNISVVINGKFCIIAIELTKELSEKDLLNFKRNIANKTKDFDNQIKYVTVTTAPSLVEKAKDMANFHSEASEDEEKENLENILPEDIEEEIINLTPVL